jgi:hypothetical protein
MNAPTYKVAKHVVKLLNRHLTLRNQYNVKNSTNLSTDITKLKLNKNHQLITNDIKDLYVNIPIEEALKITKSMLLKNNDAQITQQIITLMELILSQNYFTFQNNIYQPEKGVSMGSRNSSTTAEIFLRLLEDIQIKQLLETKNITLYTRYVDDILIIYDTKRTNTNLVNKYISQIHTNIKLNPSYESNGCMSCLDLLIIGKESNLEINIHCKPTTADTTINFLSNQPTEHKIPAYRHHITRMHSLPLTPKQKQS